jgi:hypothetical protein
MGDEADCSELRGSISDGGEDPGGVKFNGTHGDSDACDGDSGHVRNPPCPESAATSPSPETATTNSLLPVTDVKQLQPEDELDARALDPNASVEIAEATPPLAASTETDARPFRGGGPEAVGPSTPIDTDIGSSSYSLDGPKLVIIFNHREFSPHFGLKPRRGTEVDVKKISETFQRLNWQIRVIDNAKHREVQGVIRDIQNSGRWRFISYVSSVYFVGSSGTVP